MPSRLLIGTTMLFGLVAAASSPSLHGEDQRHARARRFVETRELYRHLAEQQHPASTVWRGGTSGWLTDYATAEATFDAILRRTPTDVDALVGKAYVLAWQERGPEAATLLARASELAPDRVDVQLARVRQAVIAGELRAAERDLDRVLAHAPTNREALDLRATVRDRRAREGLHARVLRLLSRHS